jgi:hypothetical protein
MTPPATSRRRRWSVVLLLCGACSGGLFAPPAGPTTRPASEHLWVFQISGGTYAAHIQLVAIGDHAPPLRSEVGRVFRPIASRAADGTPANDFAGVVATAEDSTGTRWTLRRPDGQVLRLAYTIAGDTAAGSFTLPDGTRYPVVGVRFDSAAVSLVAPSFVPVSDGPQPVVMIRLDDIPATDRDFLTRLTARGLIAEIAAPTRYPGRDRALTWGDLAYWRAQGMGIVMHSRFHLRTGTDAQHLIPEIVGGFAEMKAHGFPTNIFVQPGTWGDSIYFDSPKKLSAWRGALLRTFATVSECYAYEYGLPRTAVHPLGLGHVTISDGKSDAGIREAWGVAQRPNHATVFLVHTHNLRQRGRLDWFLDLVAAAQARGTVRLVANAQDLFSAPSTRAPQPVDSVPGTGTGTEIQQQTP